MEKISFCLKFSVLEQNYQTNVISSSAEKEKKIYSNHIIYFKSDIIIKALLIWIYLVDEVAYGYLIGKESKERERKMQ